MTYTMTLCNRSGNDTTMRAIKFCLVFKTYLIEILKLYTSICKTLFGLYAKLINFWT